MMLCLLRFCFDLSLPREMQCPLFKHPFSFAEIYMNQILVVVLRLEWKTTVSCDKSCGDFVRICILRRNPANHFQKISPRNPLLVLSVSALFTLKRIVM